MTFLFRGRHRPCTEQQKQTQWQHRAVRDTSRDDIAIALLQAHGHTVSQAQLQESLREKERLLAEIQAGLWCWGALE